MKKVRRLSEQSKNVTKIVIGKRVRHFRKRVGMTQTELGRAVGYSSPSGSISQIEAGSKNMPRDKVHQAAKAIGVDPTVLLTDWDYTLEQLEVLADLGRLLRSKKEAPNLHAIKQLIASDAAGLLEPSKESPKLLEKDGKKD